jgi:ankyrin repeat protein
MGESSECINYLIDLGVDINEKDSCGHSAIQDAVAMGRLESLKCLIAKKADINEKNQYNGRSLLHFAARGAHLSCLKLLIELGADVNARDDKDNTPLHSVGKNHYLEHSDSVLSAAEELIKAGADLSAVNNRGASPLKNCYVKALKLKKPELFPEMGSN